MSSQSTISNNAWYLHCDADTVVIFVHGIFSSSASCWLYQDKSRTIFWPQLLAEDPRIRRISIFLGGYYTGPDSRAYDISACAAELFAALKRIDATDFRRPPMEKRRIIFVCHSTGGIVVRYMLESNHGEFASKEVGLVLIASPSYGSRLADTFKWVSQLYDHKLSAQLAWGNWSIQDLDDRFKNLLARKLIPHLQGAEAYENVFIVRNRWLPSRRYVVEKLSAGRYFAAPRLLRGTDHFSSAKPDSLSHPSHEFLFDFISEKYPDLVVSRDVLSKLGMDLSASAANYLRDNYGYEQVWIHSSDRPSPAELAAVEELLERKLLQLESDNSYGNERSSCYAITAAGRIVSEQIKNALIEGKKKSGARYFVYVSASKVEMLFSQISQESNLTLFRKADEVIKHINETEDVGSIKSPGKYFSGTIEMMWGPFGGVYPTVEGAEPLVYFSGTSERTLVALCGSTKHVVGMDIGKLGMSHAHSHSLTPTIEAYFLDKLDLEVPAKLQEMGGRFSRSDPGDLIHALMLASSQMRGPVARLEFLARKLLYEKLRDDRERDHLDDRDHDDDGNRISSILLGTPIFVSMAD
jgi:Alpha/beta hydrolase family